MAPRPRGRPRKKPTTRMAAAIEAMKPFGFPENLVVTTIKELQQVYGEEGWLFIEHASYQVLLDAILDKDEGEGSNNSKKPAAETVSGAHEPSSSDVNPPNTALQTSNGLESASVVTKALRTEKKLTNESGTLVQQELKHDLPSVKAEAKGSMRSHVHHPGSITTSQNTPPIGVPTARHRPAFGWISNNDEENVVILRPGPWAIEVENRRKRLRQRENKRRWDVQPEDL